MNNNISNNHPYINVKSVQRELQIVPASAVTSIICFVDPEK